MIGDDVFNKNKLKGNIFLLACFDGTFNVLNSLTVFVSLFREKVAGTDATREWRLAHSQDSSLG